MKVKIKVMTVLELYQKGKAFFDLMDRKNLSLKGYYGYVPLVNEMKIRLHGGQDFGVAAKEVGRKFSVHPTKVKLLYNYMIREVDEIPDRRDLGRVRK